VKKREDCITYVCEVLEELWADGIRRR